MGVVGASLTLFLVLAERVVLAQTRTEFVPPKSSLRANIHYGEFESHLRDALGTLQGCGEPFSHEQLDHIKKALRPTWRALPKIGHGRIEPRLLRYIVHRYFMQSSSIMIRGFEPNQVTNKSFVDQVGILAPQMPTYVKEVLTSQHAEQHGFDFNDTVYMVGALQRLLSDSDASILDKVYSVQGFDTHHDLSRSSLERVLQDFMVYWLLGDDQTSIQDFLADRDLLWKFFPRWDKIYELIRGQIKSFDFRRHRSPRASSGFGLQYSFQDAREVVQSITESFASFWEDECISMKNQLIAMDTHHTGRVPLSKFYSEPLSTEWRFGESEEYLRALGALDETSRWHGKEVIIANYVAAASNCIIATPQYLVCCEDRCEGILGEIEAEVGAPVASPDHILVVASNMSSQLSLDLEEKPRLEGALSRQLAHIAEHHGGKVPLHGRLFAQWLHYTFPRDCPYPHMTGLTSVRSPAEFGDYVVKEEDRLAHAKKASNTTAIVWKDDDVQWMSQWIAEEELLSDYSLELHAPWEVPWITIFALAALVVMGVTGTTTIGSKAASGALLPMHRRAHYV